MRSLSLIFLAYCLKDLQFSATNNFCTYFMLLWMPYSILYFQSLEVRSEHAFLIRQAMNKSSQMIIFGLLKRWNYCGLADTKTLRVLHVVHALVGQAEPCWSLSNCTCSWNCTLHCTLHFTLHLNFTLQVYYTILFFYDPIPHLQLSPIKSSAHQSVAENAIVLFPSCVRELDNILRSQSSSESMTKAQPSFAIDPLSQKAACRPDYLHDFQCGLAIAFDQSFLLWCDRYPKRAK